MKFDLKRFKKIITPIVIVLYVVSLGSLFYLAAQLSTSKNQNLESFTENQKLQSDLETTLKELEELASQDQIVINNNLEEEIKKINQKYKAAISVYEDLNDLKVLSKNLSAQAGTAAFDQQYAKVINLLADKKYEEAQTEIDKLNKDLTTEKAKVTAASVTAPAAVTAPQNNTPPSSGYSRQTVNTDAGSFVVSIISADLSSTKVIVDTASDSDCSDNCPVLPLGTYVSRSGAYAGVNGSYFCPASYPTCAGKTNSFDLLVMNKNKYYFNSSNNVYSNNPAVIFGGGYIRFVSSASQWGRDTGIDSMLSNYPLLVEGGNIRFGGDDDPKKGSKGNRSFVANKGNIVFIGVVHSATVAESARVMSAMGMENALNLDDGGSTALWSGGYKVGPGRDLPNAILFVKK